MRHAGDLGNVPVGSDGKVTYDFTDSVISLDPASPAYIVHRSVVLHAGTDDLGLGSSTPPLSSNTTGNAGGRWACNVIVPSISAGSR